MATKTEPKTMKFSATGVPTATVERFNAACERLGVPRKELVTLALEEIVATEKLRVKGARLLSNATAGRQ